MLSRDIFIIIFILTIVAYLAIRRYYRISTLVFFYGLVGVLAGIFTGAVLVLPFNYIASPYTKWMPWVISFIAPVLFLEIFVFQGERFAKYLQRSLGTRVSSIWFFRRYIPPILVDRMTLANPKFLKMVEAGFVWGHVMIPKQSYDLLKKDLEGSDKENRIAAAKALEAYAVLADTPRIILEKVFLREDMPFNDSLLETVYSRGGKIYTFDENIVKLAKKASVEAVDLNKIIR